MDTILLKAEQPVSETSVPNIFIDRYMPSANGEYVKVYLYLLRLLSQPEAGCSLSQLADLFEYSMRELSRAFRYWERMGLLEMQYNENNELCEVTLLKLSDSTSGPDPFSKAPAETETSESTISVKSVSTPPKAPSSAETSHREYSKDELKNFSNREDVGELIFIAEQYLKKPLTHTELNTFLYWYDTLHFSTELIVYLVEYCVSRDHRSVRYMDKVALSWAEAGIRDVDAAKQISNLYSQANYAVIKALGIKGRNLVELETAMIEKWTKEYHFSLDIITEACNRTITATHQPSFEYADKILTNWHNANVKELADIERLDSNFKKAKRGVERPVHTNISKPAINRFNNFSQRTYDYDQLEQQMLNRNRN